MSWLQIHLLVLNFHPVNTALVEAKACMQG